MYKTKKWILTILAIIFVIASGIFGFLLTWSDLKPLSENQFMACEQIAQDAYAQGVNNMFDASEEFTVIIVENTISVRFSDESYIGYITAELQDGVLVTTRNPEINQAIAFCIIHAFILAICAVFIIAVIYLYHDFFEF